MSRNWLNSEAEGGEGKYLLGDITGADGLPDGLVNLVDLISMSSQWLDQKPSE